MKKKTIILGIGLLLIIMLATLAVGIRVIVKSRSKEFAKDPEFYKSLGNYLAEKGDYAHAVVAYESALLLGEDNNVRNNLAVIYYDRGKHLEAIGQLRKLIQTEPNNPSYHYDLAVNLVDDFRDSQEQSLEGLQEALLEYEKADSLSPGYSHAKENIDVLKRLIVR